MIYKIIKLSWIVITFLILGVTLYGFDGKPNSDIADLLVWSMLVLSFPAGLLVSLVYVALDNLFSIWFYTSYLTLTIDWLGFFALGYIQWFLFVPYLIKKWKNRQTRR